MIVWCWFPSESGCPATEGRTEWVRVLNRQPSINNILSLITVLNTCDPVCWNFNTASSGHWNKWLTNDLTYCFSSTISFWEFVKTTDRWQIEGKNATKGRKDQRVVLWAWKWFDWPPPSTAHTMRKSSWKNDKHPPVELRNLLFIYYFICLVYDSSSSLVPWHEPPSEWWSCLQKGEVWLHVCPRCLWPACGSHLL